MDKIKDSYYKLKEQIYAFNEQQDTSSIVKLVQLKNIDDDVKETLVLLHSNNMAQMQEVQRHVNRVLHMSIDIQIDTINELIKYIEEENKKVEVTAQPTSKLTLLSKLIDLHNSLNTVEKVGFMAIILFIVFFLFYFISPDTFKSAYGAIHMLIKIAL